MSDPQQPPSSNTQDSAVGGAGKSPARAAEPRAEDAAVAVGARLRQLREEKGWSVDDVSTRLKVAPAKLQAIEYGALGELPDQMFAIGVVRGYAKALGIDPLPLTHTLRRAHGAAQPDMSLPAARRVGLPRGRVSVTLNGGAKRRRSWWWLVILFVLVVAALAVWRNSGSMSGQFSRFALSSGASGAIAVPAVDEASGADGASMAPSEARSAMPTPVAPVAAGENAASAHTLAAMAGSGVPASSVTSQDGRSATGQTASPPAAGSSALHVRVSRDSWIGVRQKDGKTIFSGVVRAGADQRINGQAPLRVTVGNTSGLVSMELDGHPVDPSKYAAAKGNVARFTVP